MQRLFAMVLHMRKYLPTNMRMIACRRQAERAGHRLGKDALSAGIARLFNGLAVDVPWFVPFRGLGGWHGGKAAPRL